MDRNEFKHAVRVLLDTMFVEHPLGHQTAYATRYTGRTTAGRTIELMFEKGALTPANIWVEEAIVTCLLTSGIPFRRSASSSLRSQTGKNGKTNYGRHSALEHMPLLGDADLICFAPKNFEQLGRLIDHLVKS